MHESFTKWTKMLFGNAWAYVNFNGIPCKEFKMDRGDMQGSPLASYFFLLIMEVLNHIIKIAMIEGIILGVKLLVGGKQQCISQYTNDSSFFDGEEKSLFDELACLLAIYHAWRGTSIDFRPRC